VATDDQRRYGKPNQPGIKIKAESSQTITVPVNWKDGILTGVSVSKGLSKQGSGGVDGVEHQLCQEAGIEDQSRVIVVTCQSGGQEHWRD